MKGWAPLVYFDCSTAEILQSNQIAAFMWLFTLQSHANLRTLVMSDVSEAYTIYVQFKLTVISIHYCVPASILEICAIVLIKECYTAMCYSID